MTSPANDLPELTPERFEEFRKRNRAQRKRNVKLQRNVRWALSARLKEIGLTVHPKNMNRLSQWDLPRRWAATGIFEEIGEIRPIVSRSTMQECVDAPRLAIRIHPAGLLEIIVKETPS